MRFDTADLDLMEQDGILEIVIMHEMGHVLGIGTMWSSKGFLVDPSVGNPGADTHFTGPQALSAFDNVGGGSYPDQKVPVENDTSKFGQGSLDSHWREGVFDNELMTPSVGGMRDGRPLSIVTAASLADLGYVVNMSAAEPYTLPPSPRPDSAPSGIVLVDDIDRGPRYEIQPDGSLVPLPMSH